eukprot:TRINITY_DN12240_c0_g1_i1.p1 TRINITY_DN12240_c0_g1~~TRINITY_DN12240_c0_g1_i1.p1  ORF type:complete len:476 (-),score=81.39 TRINITY_DN12240_c0_g1_i1:125-1552(-)
MIHACTTLFSYLQERSTCPFPRAACLASSTDAYFIFLRAVARKMAVSAPTGYLLGRERFGAPPQGAAFTTVICCGPNGQAVPVPVCGVKENAAFTACALSAAIAPQRSTAPTAVSLAAATKAPPAIHSPMELSSKGAISILQEYVQCSRQTKVGPLNRPILQWEFDTRMADYVALQFRATVAFLLDGVPHHAAGGWHMSKKHAQRDAAERCLAFFVGAWGQLIASAMVDGDEGKAGAASGTTATMKAVANGEMESPVQALERFCAHCPALSDSFPMWSTRWESGRCQAFLEISLLQVPHKFAGALRESAARARADVACRALWYLQCPGYEDGYELDPDAPAATDRDIPPAVEHWLASMVTESLGCEDDPAHYLAERKTVLMRTQNRLQQTFARNLRPGQSVWDWSFEMRNKEHGNWPPQCRATVHLPVANRSFVGDWARGQRDAQLSACARVNAFLDARGATASLSPSSSSPASS